MTFYDIFNGDADGICALTQLRLAQPLDAVLITGVKRDTLLLDRVFPRQGDHLTVLDVSMDSNATSLMRILETGASCFYCDHHFAGTIPPSPSLQANIDTASTICTSLIVDRYLGGTHRAWAVVAAFGDNLRESALAAALPLGLTAQQLALLQELGELFNYNAYGETISDLHFHPAALFRRVVNYPDPFRFIETESVFATLRNGYQGDMAHLQGLHPDFDTPGGAVYVLPDAPWSRRVSGSFGNKLAHRDPNRAHAVLTRRGDDYLVSVRAPTAHPIGADSLCRQFATGGGRSGAAGINRLAAADLSRFMDAFTESFPAR